MLSVKASIHDMTILTSSLFPLFCLCVKHMNILINYYKYNYWKCTGGSKVVHVFPRSALKLFLGENNRG